MVYFRIADAYAQQDQYPQALESYRTAREKFDRAFGPNSPSAGLILVNSSLLQVSLSNLDEALTNTLDTVALYEQAAKSFG